ncbi:hypothetical protein C8R45DRAFT_163525 [Mycena sanguinolenta]|nr:hypothetical protein C8R45DRAFT_163525 [Mycena sanguinolenta]
MRAGISRATCASSSATKGEEWDCARPWQSFRHNIIPVTAKSEPVLRYRWRTVTRELLKRRLFPSLASSGTCPLLSLTNMKFSALFIALTAVAAVSAARVDTNADRMARGLPPKAPAQRSTPALAAAKRSTPSGVPPPQCKGALEPCFGLTECCSEICLLGVSVQLSEFMNASVLMCSDYSFAFNWRTEIVHVCVPYLEGRCVLMIMLFFVTWVLEHAS